jgi:hypothetical protein
VNRARRNESRPDLVEASSDDTAEPVAAGTNRAALIAFIVLVAGFAILALLAAIVNPPWEAPDEPSHVQNVETLVDGHWYRIKDGVGIEAHQPPLYYLLLAGLQKAAAIPSRTPDPVGASQAYFCFGENGRPLVPIAGTPLRCTAYLHNGLTEAADKRLVRLLRLPSVLFGVAVLLLTGATARRLSKDPWTPFVATAFVAGVPGFVFTSAIVNNDGLVNLLSAATLLVAVAFVNRAPKTTREGWPYAAALGALTGSLLITKLYGPAIALGVIASIGFATRWSAERIVRRFDFTLVAAGAFIVVTAWWLIQNQRWYGDPLALTKSHDYLAAQLGLGFPRHYGAARILFGDVPKTLYNTFFYNSGAGRLLWLPLLGSVACLALPGRRLPRRNWAQLLVVATFVVGAVVALSVVALQTASFRASTAYLGLPAIACLAALGLQRLPVPTGARVLTPLVGCVVTLVLYQHNLASLRTH